MAGPLVSIIVPCYRAEETIAETVRSVLAQSHREWELLLVSDDGYSYRELLDGNGISDPRIIEHPTRTERGGHVAARRRGMAVAQGDFVADLDADDIWLPDRLAKLLPLARRWGAAQDVLECFDGSGVLGYSGACDGRVEMLKPVDVVAIDFPFHLIAARPLLQGLWIDGVSASPDGFRAAMVAVRGRLAWLQQPLMRYRVRATSLSGSADGGEKIGAAYLEIIRLLSKPHAFDLPRDLRLSLIDGYRRKWRLNRAHMIARERDPATPSFIPWILDGAEMPDPS
jgi:glycosyltransferase involved in cell wall biosynthesis